MTDAALPRPTDRLPLGDGLEVSPFCVGITNHDDTFSAAFDAGINFFFLSADMHWPLYAGARRSLARLLARGPAVRDEVVVAAACYPTQPEFCSMPFLELVDAVEGLGHLDVLVSGGTYGRDWALRRDVYARHRAERFVGCRAVGATFHERAVAPTAVEASEIDLALVRYNPLHLGARREVFAVMPERPRPPLFTFNASIGWRPPEAYVAAGHGELWLPEVTDHYRFALGEAAVDGLLCSLGEPAHVASLVEAMEAGPLPVEDANHLVALARLEL